MKRFIVVILLSILLLATPLWAFKVQVGLIPRHATAPSTCKSGESYINTAENVLYFCEDDTWISTGTGGNYFASIELGHATENTLTASGGVLSVEGDPVITSGILGAAYDTEAELDALFAAKEDQLDNEAGLYGKLSDVSDFTQPSVNETITGRWEWQDDIDIAFGNDDDIGASYDTSQSHWALKYKVDSGNVIDEGATFAIDDVTLTVDATTGLYTNCFIKIEDEYLKVTTIDGLNLTVTRGARGSTAATHADATAIYLYKPLLWASSSGMGSLSTATPGFYAYDSGSAYTDTTFDNIRTEQFAGAIKWNMIDTTEDSQDSDITVTNVTAGSEATVLDYDQSDAEWDFQANAITTTGLISGGVKTVVDADGGDPDAYCYGGVWYASGAGEIDLPAVAVGMELTIENHTDGDVYIDPDGSEQIKLNGATALTGGFRILGTDIGDSCVLRYYSAGVWSAYCYGYADAGS